MSDPLRPGERWVIHQQQEEAMSTTEQPQPEPGQPEPDQPEPDQPEGEEKDKPEEPGAG
jgi:hypothetical protein